MMRLYRIAALALAVVFLLAVPALASGTKISDVLAMADNFFALRADPAKLNKAIETYEQALKLDPKNAEAAWKLARALYRQGMHSPKDKKEEIFERSVAAAKKAIADDPKSVPGHFWLSVAYGMYGSAKGVMKSLSLIDPIKEEAQFVIDHDPKYDGGGGYRVLGRLYFKVPGLFGGDNDLAVKNLKKAIELGPKRYNSYIFLAEVYLDEDEKDKAKALLEQVIKGPAAPGLEPEDADWKAKAQKMLQELK